jgi:hypothetical protein
VIARFPIEYDLLKSVSSNTGSANEENLAIRNKYGKLTKYGREQVLLGREQCKPWDVPYDPVRRRRRSHENAHLVTVAIYASDVVNKKFGFTSSDDSFHVNLRFIADYRFVAAVIGLFCFLVWALIRYTLLFLNGLFSGSTSYMV